MSRVPTVFNWSGGKDSAQALGRLLESPSHEVVGLATTTSGLTEFGRHGLEVEPLWGLSSEEVMGGELGEYHSFVHDAPFFAAPVAHEVGEPVLIESVVETTDGPHTYRWWCLPVLPTHIGGSAAAFATKSLK